MFLPPSKNVITSLTLGSELSSLLLVNMTYRVLLLQGGQIFCLTMKTVYVYVFRTASATVYCTVKQLTNDRRAEICARLQ